MFGRKAGKKADPAKPKAEKKDRKKARAEKASRKAAPRAAGPMRKQPTNIYTVMLLLAMLAMLAANILMWLEYFHYGGGLPTG